ncbi:MAG: hypothetical protein HC767_01665 [Akkermansiaceae bacterium]|nr:hypothetical protein [Akkermansiaceae bacterium]
MNLTVTQQSNIAAFLRTLSGNSIYTDPKWSSPFNAQNELSLIVLPASSMTFQPLGNGTAEVTNRGVAALSYKLESSTDLTNWTQVTTLTADQTGFLRHAVPMNIQSKCFYRFSYTPPSL